MRLTEGLRWGLVIVGFTAITIMMLSTLSDVFARLLANVELSGFLPASLPGVLDVTELAQLGAAHLAVAAAFLGAAHVSVDILTSCLPAITARWMASGAAFISAIVMAACAWQAWIKLADAMGSYTISPVLGWPEWLYWMPVAVGLTLACFAACIVAVRPASHEVA